MVLDWWAASVKLLNTPTLLKDLLGYDKENMSEKLVTDLGNFLHHADQKEDLSQERVAKASVVCKSMMEWIKAMYDFYFVNKVVKPKKARLKEASEKADKLEKQLAEKEKVYKNAMD